MRKDIPEYVAKAIKALNDFCIDKECDNCPFLVPEHINTNTSRCLFHQGSPATWNVNHTYYIEWSDKDE